VVLIESRRIRVPITGPGFARLLARLHTDAEEAGREYERLRGALVRFFEWRGAWPPEECADEALDRLAQKLEEKVVDDVRQYAHGIARHVLLEQRRRPVFSSIEEHPEVATVPTTPPDDDPLQRCFERCLADAPDDGRALVLQYYEGERHARITHRRRLAAALGVSENALRSRVQRLRDQLELCVQSCISETEVSDRHGF
jgi:DNA-directed RNA polymerase specialized sigma24 family protein